MQHPFGMQATSRNASRRTVGFLDRSTPWARATMAFIEGDPAPGTPPSLPADGNDQARAEAQKRLEAEAQANRSLRGRLRKIEGLRPDVSDQEIADLLAVGLKAKSVPEPKVDEEPEPEGSEEDKSKRKPTTIGLAEHKAAVARERESLSKANAERLKAIEAERDTWKAKYLDREIDTKLVKVCPETVHLPAALAAVKSKAVPFHFALDENSGDLLVIDNATGNDYRDSNGRFVTAPEALASMVKLVPWTATEKVVTGAGSGGGAVGGTAPGPANRKPVADMTGLDKLVSAVK